MLKEQVAEILNYPVNVVDKDDNNNVAELWLDEREKLAKQILNLFKAEVDKLTVMGEEERGLLANKLSFGCRSYLLHDEAIEAQLQHNKKQLLDLMEE